MLAHFKREVKEAYEKQLRLQGLELKRELEEAQEARIKALRETYTRELNSLKVANLAQSSLLKQKERLVQKLYRLVSSQEY